MDNYEKESNDYYHKCITNNHLTNVDLINMIDSPQMEFLPNNIRGNKESIKKSLKEWVDRADVRFAVAAKISIC